MAAVEDEYIRSGSNRFGTLEPVPDNQQVLTKAIEKAIASGFNILFTDWKIVGKDCHIEGTFRGEWLLKDHQVIVFNHGFAKALWGESIPQKMILRPDKKTEVVGNLGWQHHLRQMVVADDPIAYLGENI